MIERTNALSESLKLRGLLRQLPDRQLREIAIAWGFKDSSDNRNIETLSGEGLAEYLYPRMNSEKYFQQMWDALSDDEKETLKFLTVHGGELSRDELLQRMFKGAVRSFRRVVENLLDKGLVYEATEIPGIASNMEQWLFMPEVFMMFVDLPVHCQGFLGNLLRRLSVDELTALAKRVLKLEDYQLPSPLELRYRVRRYLVEPAKLSEFINQLSDVEQNVFDDILGRKGQCLYRDLLDATGAKKVDHSKAEFINSLCQTTGLVFTINEGHNKYMNSLIVPRDLFYIINRKFQPDMRSLQRIEAMAGVRKEAPTLPPLDNSFDILRDFAVFAARLDIYQPKRLASGGINKADLKRIGTIFPAAKQFHYATFLSTFIIDSAGFVEVDGCWRAPETFARSLDDPAATYGKLFQWWLKTVTWNELYLDGVAAVGEKPPQLWTDIVELRQVVLSGLRSVQKDRWVSFGSFYESLIPLIDANLTRGSGGGGYGGILSVKESVYVIIKETLFYLGVSVIANTENADDPSASKYGKSSSKVRGKAEVRTIDGNVDFQFRLSPLGRKIISSDLIQLSYELSDDNPLENKFANDARWIIVQPNLEIVAPRDLNLNLTFQIARLCHVRNMDVMTTLEVSRESLRPAIDRGADKDSILSFLSSISRMELPASVLQIVDEASTKHGEVRLGSSSGYIIAENELVLESIWRHPKLSSYIKERHGESVLLLANETDINKVARELRNQGHSPQMETGAVHTNADNRYHLSLTELEMLDMVAAVRLLAHIESILEADLSDGRAATLAHRLQPDSTGFLVSGTGAETRSRQIMRRYEEAIIRRDEENVEKYKAQMSKLVSRSVTSRGPTKFQYKGANPAIEREDIERLLKFAHEYELEVELLYVKQNEQETRVVVAPKGVEGERMYAHNPTTDTDAIYSLSRILRARLL